LLNPSSESFSCVTDGAPDARGRNRHIEVTDAQRGLLPGIRRLRA